VQRAVLDVHGLVTAHGQRFAQPVHGLSRSHRQIRDGRGQTFLDQRDGLLDRVLVEFGQAAFDVCPVQGEVLGIAPRGCGLWDMLDQNDDLHRLITPFVGRASAFRFTTTLQVRTEDVQSPTAPQTGTIGRSRSVESAALRCDGPRLRAGSALSHASGTPAERRRITERIRRAPSRGTGQGFRRGVTEDRD
jgi:hypothetical protein